jgi:hypothetical protein
MSQEPFNAAIPQTLAELRDALLPRHVSGGLLVSAAAQVQIIV